MMLQALMKSNPGSDYIYVVDTRPKVTPLTVACPVSGAVTHTAVMFLSTAERHGKSSRG